MWTAQPYVEGRAPEAAFRFFFTEPRLVGLPSVLSEFGVSSLLRGSKTTHTGLTPQCAEVGIRMSRFRLPEHFSQEATTGR